MSTCSSINQEEEEEEALAIMRLMKRPSRERVSPSVCFAGLYSLDHYRTALAAPVLATPPAKCPAEVKANIFRRRKYLHSSEKLFC